VSFQAGGDLCLGFFQACGELGLLPPIPHGGKVLEIGCAEADWLTPMKAARPDLHLTGLDQRDCGKRPGADALIRADVLTYDFPPASFDVIIAVSMIEWAGIDKYGAPVDPVGDLHTLQRARTWIKPDGWLYFDVPYSPDGSGRERNAPMRVYTDADFTRLLAASGWAVEARQFFEGILDVRLGNRHPDGPYLAHVVRPA
jgi:SAM-dependent methyltransferase